MFSSSQQIITSHYTLTAEHCKAGLTKITWSQHIGGRGKNELDQSLSHKHYYVLDKMAVYSLDVKSIRAALWISFGSICNVPLGDGERFIHLNVHPWHSVSLLCKGSLSLEQFQRSQKSKTYIRKSNSEKYTALLHSLESPILKEEVRTYLF